MWAKLWLILKLVIKWGPSFFALVEELIRLLSALDNATDAESHTMTAFNIITDKRSPTKEKKRRFKEFVERLRRERQAR